MWRTTGILGKTLQSEPYPRDPRKSWKKPHNLSPIPGTPGNPRKNLTILRICLVVVVVVVGWFRQAVQRPPAGAKKIANVVICIVKFEEQFGECIIRCQILRKIHAICQIYETE